MTVVRRVPGRRLAVADVPQPVRTAALERASARRRRELHHVVGGKHRGDVGVRLQRLREDVGLRVTGVQRLVRVLEHELHTAKLHRSAQSHNAMSMPLRASMKNPL